MKMEIKKYEFILEAQTPIAHHSEVFGNSAVLMTRTVRQRDGSFTKLPIVTGDTMRHGMREAAAYALLDAAGLLEGGAGLGEAALRLLFAGGMVTGRGDAGQISLEKYRTMAELIPSMALFGGCADNRVIPGRLDVGDATLLCAENEAHLSDWAREWARESTRLDTYRSHVEEVMRVRMDPTLDTGKRKLLSAVAEVETIKRLEAGEAAHVADDAPEREAAKSSMMPRSFQTLVQGSLFTWSVSAVCYSELDVDTFHTAVGAFLANATVGGKRGTGHGKIRAIQAKDVSVLRPAERAETLELSTGRVGGLFRAHVAERRDQIRAWLEQVNA